MRTNGHGKPVVSVDIDGTLADYHGWFLRFAQLYFGRTMPKPEEINPGRPLWVHMGVGQRDYRDCKLAYRQGGMKRSMPCLEGAADLLSWVRSELGAEVWICTTRPYLRLDNIDPDTREWLGRNSIPYDALLFDPSDGDDKYHELARQTEDGARVACVVEDLPEQAATANVLGFQVFLRDQPYNRHVSTGSPDSDVWGYRWETVDQLQLLIAAAVDNWRAKQ